MALLIDISELNVLGRAKVLQAIDQIFGKILGLFQNFRQRAGPCIGYGRHPFVDIRGCPTRRWDLRFSCGFKGLIAIG